MDKNKRVYWGRAPLQGEASCDSCRPAPLSGCAARLSQLTPRVKGAREPLGPSLLHILQKKDEVLARERDPLVLQLDTFGETIGRIPVLRGKRLHVL